MKKIKLLLLDANIVIELFEQNLWDRFIEKCDVHLTRSVLRESKYWIDENERQKPINLKKYEMSNFIQVHDVLPSELDMLLKKFGSSILEKLDIGEAESLALLCNSSEQFTITSSDKIVFRVLGALNRSEQGISLEEILHSIGLTKSLRYEYGRKYRIEWSQKGFDEGFSGSAFKKPQL